jgi:hypothetical protein
VEAIWKEMKELDELEVKQKMSKVIPSQMILKSPKYPNPKNISSNKNGKNKKIQEMLNAIFGKRVLVDVELKNQENIKSTEIKDQIKAAIRNLKHKEVVDEKVKFAGEEIT